jgi:surface protein
MNSMFENSMFIGDISKWKPIKVENMCCMFWGFGNENNNFNAKKFDISKWDVSSVTDMSAMFAHSSFNSDISNWNVRNVLDMRNMFMCCDFYQDISNWKVNTKCETYDMFEDCPLGKGDFPDKYKPEGIY